MPDMLSMSAFENRAPVTIIILIKVCDFASHLSAAELRT